MLYFYTNVGATLMTAPGRSEGDGCLRGRGGTASIESTTGRLHKGARPCEKSKIAFSNRP